MWWSFSAIKTTRRTPALWIISTKISSQTMNLLWPSVWPSSILVTRQGDHKMVAIWWSHGPGFDLLTLKRHHDLDIHVTECKRFMTFMTFYDLRSWATSMAEIKMTAITSWPCALTFPPWSTTTICMGCYQSDKDNKKNSTNWLLQAHAVFDSLYLLARLLARQFQFLACR